LIEEKLYRILVCPCHLNCKRTAGSKERYRSGLRERRGRRRSDTRWWRRRRSKRRRTRTRKRRSRRRWKMRRRKSRGKSLSSSGKG
jgi:hypothetical protein